MRSRATTSTHPQSSTNHVQSTCQMGGTVMVGGAPWCSNPNPFDRLLNLQLKSNNNVMSLQGRGFVNMDMVIELSSKLMAHMLVS
ncbi:hypothetical protein COCNU_07G007560 [Cocos nucifera]|uniref:Uncharacterized protein n=1 Tax=Cocos nucifera TaxID=13894 RepID=A0A8K0IFR0_COCNU|nr:hypothetical protein COCNU_07G007560 [Cocos nucifera]